MKIRWLVETNAKSSKNATVLLNQLAKQLEVTPLRVCVEGDRYCGHRISFEVELHDESRDVSVYRLLLQSERVANSWTLCRVSAPAHSWSTRSRIAGVQRYEWVELDE